MSAVFTVLLAAVVLGILIFVHEAGHFLAAKLMGVRVEAFSLGFGKRLIGIKRGDTDYRISAVPLGGYVKMTGEVPGEDELTGAEDEFYSKSIPRRIFIVIAGPLFNIIFAFFLYTLVFTGGQPKMIPVVGEVAKDMPAAAAGIQSGDKIINLDDGIEQKTVTYWEDLPEYLHSRADVAVDITLIRESETLVLNITPVTKEIETQLKEKRSIGLIGISPSGETVRVDLGLFGAVKTAFVYTGEVVVLVMTILKKLVTGALSIRNVAGVIGIAEITGKQMQHGLANFLGFMAYISINLGVVNMIPILPFDGGNAVLFGVEAVIRRKIPVKVRDVMQQAGFYFAVFVLVFTFVNDFMRILGKYFGFAIS